jgi:hypothetical protein
LWIGNFSAADWRALSETPKKCAPRNRAWQGYETAIARKTLERNLDYPGQVPINELLGNWLWAISIRLD